jgi:hypothetical protein
VGLPRPAIGGAGFPVEQPTIIGSALMIASLCSPPNLIKPSLRVVALNFRAAQLPIGAGSQQAPELQTPAPDAQQETYKPQIVIPLRLI